MKPDVTAINAAVFAFLGVEEAYWTAQDTTISRPMVSDLDSAIEQFILRNFKPTIRFLQYIEMCDSRIIEYGSRHLTNDHVAEIRGELENVRSWLQSLREQEQTEAA